MEDNFKLEIISPEKIIFSNDVKMVTLPSYEGEMGVLKEHISIITFLRPGIVKAQKTDGNFEDFFVEDGTVEYFNNNLTLLSATAINVKNFSSEVIEKISKDTEDKLSEKNINDHDRYILNHKLNAIEMIRN